MDLLEHKKKFEEIVRKYKLQETEKAEEIAKYLVKNGGGKISLKEFSTLFAMNEEDAKNFLSFIQKGIVFKEEYIDKK